MWSIKGRMTSTRPLLAAAAVLLAAASPIPCQAQGAPATPATAAPAPDPERLAIAREIIALGFPPATRPAMLTRASEALMTQMRDGLLRSIGSVPEPELQRILDRHLERVRTATREFNGDGAPAIFEATARAYARNFSHDDLVQIRAFVSTSAGANYLQRSAELLSDPDVAEANRAHMARAFGLMQPLLEEFRREVDAYVAAQRRRQ